MPKSFLGYKENMSFIPDILKAVDLPRIDVDPIIIGNRRDFVLPDATIWAEGVLVGQYGQDITEETDRIVKPEVQAHLQDTAAEVVNLAQFRAQKEERLEQERLAAIRQRVRAA
jgi:hypothetical protein